MESALAAMNLPDSKEELEKCIKETFSASSTSKNCKWDMNYLITLTSTNDFGGCPLFCVLLFPW